MAVMAGPLWIFQVNFFPAILLALVMTYIAGYYFGGLAAVWIVSLKRPSILIGIICSFFIVGSATFMGSLVGFLKAYWNNGTEISATIHDYIYRPIGLVLILGFLPIIVLGIWLGISIKKSNANYN